MRWLVLMSAIVVGATASGCAENDQSIVISRFAASDDTTNCMITATGMVGQSSGYMYPLEGNATVGYFLFPAVRNLLPIRATMTTAETNGIIIKGFDIELQGSTAAVDAAIVPEQRKRRLAAAGGYLPPGGSSIAAVSVEVVPPATRQAVTSAVDPAATVLPYLYVKIRPVGSQGGLDLVGAYTTFPITVCTTPVPRAADSDPANPCAPTQDELCLVPQ